MGLALLQLLVKVAMANVQAPPRPLRLHLVRHGQTDANLAGICQGQTDGWLLTPLGRKQAHALGATLAGVDFHELHCSDLGRTKETTALALAERSHLLESVSYDKRLRELMLGWRQGKRFGDPPEPGAEKANPPEPIADVSVRATSWLMDLIERNAAPEEEALVEGATATRNVFVMSHGGFLNCMFRDVLQVVDEKMKLGNCCITIVDVVYDVNGGHRFELRSLAEDDHVLNLENYPAPAAGLTDADVYNDLPI
uniref:Phosphoglycerate mutase (2,3-diphosphoglycerate-dependent) n=1 Tax=Phaeomonas parva TaxID=124430 RepID=A0A7S1U6W9_9STRA